MKGDMRRVSWPYGKSRLTPKTLEDSNHLKLVVTGWRMERGRRKPDELKVKKEKNIAIMVGKMKIEIIKVKRKENRRKMNGRNTGS